MATAVGNPTKVVGWGIAVGVNSDGSITSSVDTGAGVIPVGVVSISVAVLVVIDVANRVEVNGCTTPEDGGTAVVINVAVCSTSGKI